MDIVESCSIVFYFMQVGSLTQWKINRKTWSLHRSRLLEAYSCTMMLASVALLFYDLFSDYDINMAENGTGETVDFIQVVGIRLAHIVAMLETFYRRKEENKFYEKVMEIDRILERSLNVNVDNTGFRRKMLKYGATMLVIYLSAEFFILATKLIMADEHFWFFWIFYAFPFFICGIRYFQYFVAISIIRVRFEQITNILDEVNLVAGVPTKTNRATELPAAVKLIAQAVPIRETKERHNLDMENPELKRLLVIRDIYNRLWELCTLVNRSYGVSMLINVGNDFVTIVANCYWIFLNFKEYSMTPMDFLEITGSAIWSVPHFLNLFVLALLCERAVQCTTDIALGLHRLHVDILNDNHNAVIEQFSLQLLHQKINFTAAGFFNVNCTLLYTIAGATTTYLIILIQFNMSEQKSFSQQPM